MTASAHTLYHCDCCHEEQYMPSQNAARIVPPGWSAMMCGDDKQALSPTGAISHLCPRCTRDFERFMKGDYHDRPHAQGADGKREEVSG